MLLDRLAGSNTPTLDTKLLGFLPLRERADPGSINKDSNMLSNTLSAPTFLKICGTGSGWNFEVNPMSLPHFILRQPNKFTVR